MRLIRFRSFTVAAGLFLFGIMNGYAQTTCPQPAHTIAVFFGNGIDTSRKSATRSLDRLYEEIGDTYNGLRVRYDLAYNKTSGKMLDLIQSAAQAEIQFSSDVMGWLNGIGVAPDWFAKWHESLLAEVSTVVAIEVVDHVQRYSDAILMGQKVMVVAHSQGNYYVNEAKKLLMQSLTATQLRSFAIFGVAVPANNVGGSSGPYLTNHRDIIQIVPGALSQNWALRRADGQLESQLHRVLAHSFVDTYMSTAYDIKPALLMGIKGQIEGETQPAPVCDTYRKTILSTVDGSYMMTCGQGTDAVHKPFVVSEWGITRPEGTVVNLQGPDTMVAVVQNIDSSIYLTAWNRSLDPALVDASANWAADGRFLNGHSNCSVGKDTPTSYIGHAVNATVAIMNKIQGYRAVIPGEWCSVNANGQWQDMPSPTLVWVEGTIVHLGKYAVDFSDNLSSESVQASLAHSSSPANYDPGFFIINTRLDGSSMALGYRRNQGLETLSNSSSSGDQIVCNMGLH